MLAFKNNKATCSTIILIFSNYELINGHDVNNYHLIFCSHGKK